MKTVKVKYGCTPHSATVPDGHTIGQIIADPTTKAILSYGDNVKALVSGVEQGSDSIPSDGTTIVLETKMNSKAVLTLAMAVLAVVTLVIA